MKAITRAAVVFLAVYSFAFGGDAFDAGFKAGYTIGWNGNTGGTFAPLAPLPPLPPIGGDDYQHGVAAGYQAGMRDHGAPPLPMNFQPLPEPPQSSTFITTPQNNGSYVQAPNIYTPLPPQDFARNPSNLGSVISAYNQAVSSQASTQQAEMTAQLQAQTLASNIAAINAKNAEETKEAEDEMAQIDARHDLKMAQLQAQIAALKARQNSIIDTPAQVVPSLNQHADTIDEKDLDNIDAIIKKAESGSPGYQFILGVKYLRGAGVAKNEKAGISWILLAASQGHDGAQLMLGDMYMTGDCVEKNQSEALTWYARAAYQYNPEAFREIGTALYNGTGIKKNIVQAYGWFNLGAINGDVESRYYRDELEKVLQCPAILAGQMETQDIIKSLDKEPPQN